VTQPSTHDVQRVQLGAATDPASVKFGKTVRFDEFVLMLASNAEAEAAVGLALGAPVGDAVGEEVGADEGQAH
jgi:hypothetical protein